jgi:LPXTG-motif cell wall-anchored protein
MKFLAKNINTNTDLPTNNFLDIERITNTKFFEPDKGDLSIFEKNEAEILNAIPKEEANTRLGKFREKIKSDITEQNEKSKVEKPNKSKVDVKNNLLKNKYTPLIILGILALAGIYFYKKKKN